MSWCGGWRSTRRRAAAATGISAAQRRELGEGFAYFDADRSGALDLRELVEGCKGAGIDMDAAEVEATLKELIIVI